jgi:KipI family sensor histidine kinase inhibitor
MNRQGDVLPVGDAAVLVSLGNTIDDSTSARVWSLCAALNNELRASVLDIVPAFASILIRFDPSVVRLATIIASTRGVLENAPPTPPSVGHTVHVNVCFDSEYALDLADIARSAGMREEEVIGEFCRPTYRVAFLGFTAGFPYLIGLPRALQVPRLQTPRVRVAAGSVALAAGQCGIYPRSSPGGWRVLGKTSAEVFNPLRDPAALFAPADRVIFHPVDSLEAATVSIES